MTQDYTVVLGIDAKTALQLEAVLPTWKKHKPSLFERPWIIFYDKDVWTPDVNFFLHHIPEWRLYIWPEKQVEYDPGNGSKWTNPQRHKMLAGFVYVPAQYVKTPYWLKIDTDVIATGMDNWVDEDWFVGNPAIIASPWGYTKPANQMMELDHWVDFNAEKLPPGLSLSRPLHIAPKSEDAKSVRHRRICSWCAFFRTDFTRFCAKAAVSTVGYGKLPVPSQDGYLWYVAKRMGLNIRRESMAKHGWMVRNGLERVKEAIEGVI